MAHEGRLDLNGYDMPVDAPLYAKPPIHYRDVNAISISYETDLDAALDLLPQGLEIEAPAIATLMFIQYPFSTLGPYNEVILSINCSYDGQPTNYIPHIVVDNEVPLAAGREIWGYPKKLANIEVELSAPVDVLWGKMERPSGNTICSGGIRPERPVEFSTEPTDNYGMALRLIPSPVDGASKPSIAELLRVHHVATVKEEWEGPGWVEYHTHSDVDPWHKLKVKEVVGATYRISDMILGLAEIVKTY